MMKIQNTCCTVMNRENSYVFMILCMHGGRSLTTTGDDCLPMTECLAVTRGVRQ